MNDTYGPFNLILLAVPGLALHLALRVVYGPWQRHETGLLRLVLSLAGTLLILAAAVGGLVAVSGPAIIPLGVLGLVAGLMIMDRLRRAEHRALIWSLAVAAERGIPLSEAARAYAAENRGDVGTRATRLAVALEQGTPLGQAVRFARLRLNPPMQLAVRMGESLNVLGAAMRQQIDDSQQADAVLRDTIGRFTYLLVVVIYLQAVLTFVMLKIVPVFQRMFEEFGLKLPAMTQLLINLCNWFVNYGWIYAAILVSIPLLFVGVLIFVALFQWFLEASQSWFQRTAMRRTVTVIVVLLLLLLVCGQVALQMLVLSPLPLVLIGVGLYYIGWFPRDMPLLWRVFRRYDGAMMLRGLALAVRRDVPLPKAMDLVAENYPIRYAARALSRASDSVKQGLAWPESLRRAGLIGPADAAVLGSAQRAGNLPWALEEMAESSLRRINYRLQFALQMLFPPAVIALGFFVAFFVISLFLPLIALIQGLT